MQGTGEQNTKGVRTVQKCVSGLLLVQDHLRTIQNIPEICLSGGLRRKHLPIGFAVHQFCHPKALLRYQCTDFKRVIKKKKKKLRKHPWPTPLLPKEMHSENLLPKGNLSMFTLARMNEHRWDRQEGVQHSLFSLVFGHILALSLLPVNYGLPLGNPRPLHPLLFCPEWHLSLKCLLCFGSHLSWHPCMYTCNKLCTFFPCESVLIWLLAQLEEFGKLDGSHIF